MMGRRNVGLAAMLLVFSMSSANAQLISVDWQTAGDNLITRDTVSGLEWLDLTVTASRSYDVIASMMDSGGTYEGWRYATPGEVVILLDHSGGIGTYVGTSVDHGAMFDLGLVSQWGYTVTEASSEEAYFITDDVTGTNRHGYGALVNHYASGLADVANVDFGSKDNINGSSAIGSALVRSSVVPVPGALWLLASGMLGLGVMTKRKASR